MLTSEFAAELSHDLRVPLASIMAHLEILEDELGDEPDAVVTDILARTMRAAERMERMLEQRLETDRIARDARLCEVDLLEVAQQLAVDFTWLLERSDAALEVGWLPVVHADPDEMYCVLQNLLTNAVKYVRPGVCPKVQSLPGGSPTPGTSRSPTTGSASPPDDGSTSSRCTGGPTTGSRAMGSAWPPSLASSMRWGDAWALTRRRTGVRRCGSSCRWGPVRRPGGCRGVRGHGLTQQCPRSLCPLACPRAAAS